MDGDARFAARLARAAGLYHPRDWVAVYESHTPYEWLIQRCLSVVDPWGDDRADFRAAINTLKSTPLGEGEDPAEVLSDLIDYMKLDEPDEDLIYDPEAIRRMKGKTDVR